MRPVMISQAAKQMGYCRRHALRRLIAIQKRNPNIEILIPRADPKDKWRINPIGLRRAVELEKHYMEADLSHRVGICESDLRTVHRKLRRIEICVFGNNNANSSTIPYGGNGT